MKEVTVWPRAVKYSLISLRISLRETDSSASVETIPRPRKLWETKVTVTLCRKIVSPPCVERNIWLRVWIYANRSELELFMHDLWVLTWCIPTCEMTAFHKKCVVFFILSCRHVHRCINTRRGRKKKKRKATFTSRESLKSSLNKKSSLQSASPGHLWY